MTILGPRLSIQGEGAARRGSTDEPYSPAREIRFDWNRRTDDGCLNIDGDSPV